MKSESVIRAKFKRLNVKSINTNLWEDVSEHIKSIVGQQIKMAEGEVKILFVFINTSYWWVLTNQRLVLSENNTIKCFDLNDIEKVEPKRFFEGEISKQDCNELDIYIGGQRIELKLEENTWHAIYNVLKFVIIK